jgi:hypothetical protein
LLRADQIVPNKRLRQSRVAKPTTQTTLNHVRFAKATK